jgi:predicted nucleic acid-binding protein
MLAGKWNARMTLLISDSNIFIDLYEGDLLQMMFRLPETFAVPNILFQEELVNHYPDLPVYGLQVLNINGTYMNEAYQLRKVYKGPSQNDLFALVLAKQEKCPLITGDRRLRKAAKNEGLDIRGTVWIVKRLLEEKLITVARAKDAFEEMKQAGSRLPWDEVEAMLNEFR